MRSARSSYSIRCRREPNGRIYWECVSEWDAHYPGHRLRYPQIRATRYYTEREARRWARRYKVDVPMSPQETKDQRKMIWGLDC